MDGGCEVCIDISLIEGAKLSDWLIKIFWHCCKYTVRIRLLQIEFLVHKKKLNTNLFISKIISVLFYSYSGSNA